MKILVIGNKDEVIDSLPLLILSKLRKLLPEFEFEQVDPNEEWEATGNLIIIDTVVGIKDVVIFDTLDEFEQSPRFTMHGFDLLMNLRLLKKIGKLKEIKIIGIPPMISETKAIEQICLILNPN